MSFREVTALRRAGRLQEAYNMAKADLAEEQSEWTFSAMFWVLSDQSKVFLANGEKDQAKICLEKMLDIFELIDDSAGYANRAIDYLRRKLEPNWEIVNQMSEWSKYGREEEAYHKLLEIHQKGSLDDALHEDFGWVIFRYLNHHYETIGSVNARNALFTYLQLNNPRPSKLHSQILNLSSKISEKYDDFKFLPFLRMWNVDYLSSEDFRSSYWEGKELQPLVERLMSRCFSLGYSLQDVTEAFTTNERISESIVFQAYSRHCFFEIYKLYDGGSSLLEAIRNYCNEVKNKEIVNEFHSKILSIYLQKLPENNISEIVIVLNNWGVHNFRKEDWKRESKEDKEYPSLVEKAIRRYLQALKLKQYKDADEGFIELLKEAIDHYSDDDQLERNLAQILLAKGEREEALSIYRKLLLKLNRFYIWKELADATDDVNLKISALCKSILSESNDDYLGEVHLSLCRTLIDTGQKQLAKRELNQFKETYQRNGWRPKEAYPILKQELKDITENSSDNSDFYHSHLLPAEEFVYSDIEWIPMVLVDIFNVKKDNKEKERAKLVSSDGLDLSINTKVLGTCSKKVIGSCYDVKIIHHDDRYDIGLIRPSEKKIGDILPTVTCYVDYHNKEKQCYHLTTKDNHQAILSQTIELNEGDFCLCFVVPQRDKSNKATHAIFFKKESQENAIKQFTLKTAVVDHVNISKQLFHCVFGRGMDIVVRFSHSKIRPHVGEYVQIRYVWKKLQDGRIIRTPLDINPFESSEKELTKTVIDHIRINTNSKGQPFGFVDDYYVPAHLLKDVEEYDLVKANVVFNGKKWVVFQLEKLH